MKRNGRMLLALLGITILLFSAGCSPSSGPVDEGGGGVVSEQAPPGGGEVQTEEGPSTTLVGTAPEGPPGVPADVPIMEGYRSLQIANSSNITYTVDGDIEDVVGFYQEQLPISGWESAGNPDTQAGKIAAMLRVNPNGDRISINMQHNELAGFVVVTITIARK